MRTPPQPGGYNTQTWAFNDHPNTDHAQVVEVLTRARTDLAVEHLAAIRARAPAPVGWGRRMAGWINRRGC
jgi:hypothetical protein